MKLESFTTPLTDDAEQYNDTIGLEYVTVKFAKDLERKLKLCQAALKSVYNNGQGSEVFPSSTETDCKQSWQERFDLVEQALNLTKV